MLKNGIYNFLTKKFFKIKIASSIVVLALIVLLVIEANNIFLDQNLYYYIFSTIVQGYLALVSFLGAVVIYKLQIAENSLNSINERLKGPAKYFKGAPAESFSVEEMMQLGKEMTSRTEKSFYENTVEKGYIEMDKILKEKKDIRSKMVDFSLLSFFNVGMGLIGLLISKLFLSTNLYPYAGIYLVINITLSFISMFYAFSVIRKTLGYDFNL